MIIESIDQLKSMDSIQIFEHVARHLLTQKKKAGYEGKCFYRYYEEQDVLACAVGCLIPEAHYTWHIEDLPIGTLIVLADALESKRQNGVPDEWSLMSSELFQVIRHLTAHRPMLTELQVIHDTWSPEGWPTALIAYAHKLDEQEAPAIPYTHALNTIFHDLGIQQ